MAGIKLEELDKGGEENTEAAAGDILFMSSAKGSLLNAELMQTLEGETTRLVSTTAHVGTSANFFNAVIPRAAIKPPAAAVAANAFLVSSFLL